MDVIIKTDLIDDPEKGNENQSFYYITIFEQLPTVPWTMERVHSESTYCAYTRLTFSVHCEHHAKKVKHI